MISLDRLTAAALGPKPSAGNFRFTAGGMVTTRFNTTGDTTYCIPSSSQTTDDWDTALLAAPLTVVETDAYIGIGSCEPSDRQYLTNSSHGITWLNISSCRYAIDNNSAIKLYLHGAHIDASLGHIVIFKNAIDLNHRLLVIAPHPDDAEIAAFGLYADRNATILTVTAGNAGHMNYRELSTDIGDHYRLKGTLRVIDSITVPWHGHIPPTSCYNLGYFDGRLKDMNNNQNNITQELYNNNTSLEVYRRWNLSTLLPSDKGVSTWVNLVSDMRTVILAISPATIVIPHPQIDNHNDHYYTTLAAATALSQCDNKPSILLYTNHADDSSYPYGPKGTIMSLPPIHGDVFAGSVYSFPLTPSLVRRKTFAIEAMHDIRLPPSWLYAAIDGGVDMSIGEAAPYASYLRRAVRCNELFYCCQMSDLLQMFKK